MLTVLRRRCSWLPEDQREAILHDAWAVLLEKQRDGALDVEEMQSPQLRAYLTQTAINKALDEGRRARSRDESLGDREDFAAASPAPEEVVGAGMEGAQVREIVAELSPRQQQIVKLRYFFDRSPEEVQTLLGLSERAYRRDLERAMARVSERYELVLDGRFCESRGSLIRAYVAGLAGANRAREARVHLAECPGCRRFALELRADARRVAALAPLPVLAVGQGPWDQVSRLFVGARDAVANLVGGAKQQALTISTRLDAGSPIAVAGARPGALAATIGACVAVGGATYCVVDGLPAPVRDLVGREMAEKPAPHEEARRASQVLAEPPPAPRAEVVAKPAPKPEPKRSAPTRSGAGSGAAAGAEAAATEFGFEEAAPAEVESAGGSEASAPEPEAAAPGEFDP